MRKKITLVCGVLVLFSILAQAQEKVDLSTINERLVKLETKLEEGQKAFNQRIDDVYKRFDDVNKRIDDLQINFNNSFDDVMTWLQVMATILGLVFIGIFGTLLLGWRKVAAAEAKISEALRYDERERMMVLYDQRLQILEKQIKEIIEKIA